MKKILTLICISLLCNIDLAWSQCNPSTIYVALPSTQTSAQIILNNTTSGGTYYVEYGQTGFTPGLSSTPGIGGTLIQVPSFQNFIVASGLSPGKTYDAYCRKNCSGVWSINSSRLVFNSAVDCNTAPAVSCGVMNHSNHPNGTGAWYSVCSGQGGSGGQGSEVLYRFTPTVSGMHRLYVPAGTSSTDFSYKAAASGCNENNWTCIGSNYQLLNSQPGQFLFGPLTVGTPYYIVADCQIPTPQQSSFRVECPNCPEPTNVTIYSVTPTSFEVYWSNAGYSFIEFGPKGFTPGTNASPGPGGTMSWGTSGQLVSNLYPSTEYDVYVRAFCGGGNYGINSLVTTVTTPSCSTPFYYDWYKIMTYTGIQGQYNSIGDCVGTLDNGEERIFRVTPLSPGYYTLRVANMMGPGIYYSVAINLSSCNISTASCVYPVSSSNGVEDYILGPLSANATYDVIFDVNYVGQPVQNPSIIYYFQCPKPINVTTSNYQPNSVIVNWNCLGDIYNPACQSAPLIEYGPAGFFPGAGSTSGTNGTIISGVSPPYTITGLQPGTRYDVYLRTTCGTYIYSLNSDVVSFKTPLDCSVAPVLSCGINAQYCVTPSTYTDNGAWKSNACGNTFYFAQEVVWKFTPPGTGNYSLNITGLTSSSSSTSYSSNFYIKQSNLSCNELNWNCIGTKTSTVAAFTPSALSLGTLTGGTTYYIMADGIQPSTSYCYNFDIGCPPVCTAPILTNTTTTATTATINGTCSNCTGQMYLEYGLAGFTPGIGATAGVGGTVLSNVSFPVNISGLTASSSYDVYTRNDCGSPLGFSINSNKLNFTPCFTAPIGITSNLPGNEVCYGSTIILTQSGGALPPGGTYKWYAGSCGGNVVGTGNSISVSPTTNTTYFVMIESLCGNSACSPGLNVTVALATASISAASATTFCEGGNVNLNATTGSGYTYQWKNGSNIISGALNSTYSASSTGIYSAIITNSNGCSRATNTISVTMNQLPVVSFTGLNSTYTNTSPPVTLFGTPAGGIFSGAGISGNTFSPSVAGIGGPYTINYSYVDLNGCSNFTSQQTTVTGCGGAPGQPGVISTTGGTAPVCPGDSKTYSITAVSGATSYNWTPPTGGMITSGQGTLVITISYNSSFVAAASLQVVAQSSCGNSPARTLSISRNNPATPGIITGTTFGLCGTTGIPYSVASVSGINYSWTFNSSNGTVINGQGTNSISANFNSAFTTEIISVTAQNGCGTSSPRTLALNAVPATPPSITGSPFVCANQQGVPYSITPLFGAVDYRWSAPKKAYIFDGVVTSNNWNLTTTAASVFVNYGNKTGSVEVYGNNACGSGGTASININFNCREGVFDAPVTKTEINIYPNPAHNEINVLVSNAEFFEVEIQNALGAKIIQVNNQSKIDVSNLPTALYIIKVSVGGIIMTRKINIVK